MASQRKTSIIYIADPVLGDIRIAPADAWVMDVLQTKEMQRTRFILQLGAVHNIFPGATHTRFMHQLGTFEIARRFIENFKKSTYTNEERKVVLAAALLHDLGHGPSSHSFEFYTGLDHEQYVAKILLSETEVASALKKNGINPQAVVDVLSHKTGKREWMSQLVSSQLDADRLDYLMRDAHYTGTSYGIVDRDYIIRNAEIIEGRLVFREKAVQTIENYLLSRFHMYLRVYHSKSAYSWETLVKSIVQRYKDLYPTGKLRDPFGVIKFFKPWLAGGFWSVDEFQLLTESTFQMLLTAAEHEEDRVLRRLGFQYNRRINFKAEEWSPEVERRVRRAFKNRPDSAYFMNPKHVSNAYIYNRKRGKEIYILRDNGDVVDISRRSPFLRSMRLEPVELVLTVSERRGLALPDPAL